MTMVLLLKTLMEVLQKHRNFLQISKISNIYYRTKYKVETKIKCHENNLIGRSWNLQCTKELLVEKHHNRLMQSYRIFKIQFKPLVLILIHQLIIRISNNKKHLVNLLFKPQSLYSTCLLKKDVAESKIWHRQNRASQRWRTYKLGKLYPCTTCFRRFLLYNILNVLEKEKMLNLLLLVG